MTADDNSAKAQEAPGKPPGNPSEEPAPETAKHQPAKPEPAVLPKTSMLFSAASWTFNVRLGRSGREEGEGVILMGEVSFRAPSGERRVHPGRAMIVKADAKKRLELLLSPQDSVLTIPLEPFALQRLENRLKDLVAFHGMTLRIAFAAADTADRQAVDWVDFAFSSGPQRPSMAPRPA